MDQPAKTVSPVPQKPYDIGVLFVHGIGEQNRGESLVACGEPMSSWIQDWIDGLHERWLATGITRGDVEDWNRDLQAGWVKEGISPDEVLHRFDAVRRLMETAPPGNATGKGVFKNPLVAKEIVVGRAEMVDASVRPRNDGDSAPSRAVLRTTLIRADGTIDQSHWLLAEAWWATTFAAPRFQSLAKLGLEILPWVILSHFAVRYRRSVERARSAGARLTRPLDWMASFLLACLVLGVCESLMALLLILALPPIPWLRNAVAFIQRKAAGIIGDSYVLLTSQIQAAAMSGQVQQDLAWLADQCGSVAVLAHSQGAAVAFTALQRGMPSPVRLICTYGSGLRKLEEIRIALQPGSALHKIASFVNSSFLSALMGGALLLISGALNPFALATAVFALAALLKAFHDSSARENLAHLAAWGEWFDIAEVRWIDLYASADPVPNGQVFDPRIKPKKMETREVFNESFVWSDHTTYWENRDEFIAVVTPEISALGRIKLNQIGPDDAAALEKGSIRRASRVRWRSQGRIAALVLSSLAALVLSLPLLPPGVSFIHGVGEKAVQLAGLVIKSIPLTKPWSLVWVQDLVGLTLVLVCFFAAYKLIVRRAWNGWDREETALLFGRSTIPRHERSFGTFKLRLACFAALVVLLSVGVCALAAYVF